VTFGVTRLLYYGLGFLILLFTTAPIAHPLLLLVPGAAAMGMHIQWFTKWLEGQRRRSKAAAGEGAASGAGDAPGGGAGGTASGSATGAGAIAERSSPAPRERTPTLESAGGMLLASTASTQPPDPKIHAPPVSAAAPGVIYTLAASKPKTLRPPAPRKTN
jgi:hypothetical protein